MSPRTRLKGSPAHSRNRGKILQQVVHDRKAPLRGGNILQGMDLGEFVHAGDMFGELGIVFHRARSKWIHTVVHAMHQIGKTGEMPYHIQLGHLGKTGVLLAYKILRQGRQCLLEAAWKVQRREAICLPPLL